MPAERLNRHSIFAIVAMLAFATGGVGQCLAATDTPEQASFRIARAVSRLSITRRFCSTFYVVDLVKTDKLAVALLKDGVDRFGQRQMKYALDGADAEFGQAIQKQGAAGWCPAQRVHFRKLGLPDLIGGPLP